MIDLRSRGWFGVMFLGVAFVVAAQTYKSSRAALATEAWPSVMGRVERASVVGVGSSDRALATVSYAYEIAGKTYSSNRISTNERTPILRAEAEAFVTAHPTGTPITVHYDPEEPGQAVLEKAAPLASTRLQWISVGVLATVGIALLLLESRRPR
jgi:hypothetical protein